MLITLTQIKTHLWQPNMTDATAQILYDQAYWVLCGLCGVQNFDDDLVTDRFNFIWNWPYYLRSWPRKDNTHNHTIHAVNWVDVDYWDWIEVFLQGRRVEFSSSLSLQPKSVEWNTIEIQYHSGFNWNIPSDFLGALYSLISSVNIQSKSEWMKSYSQWDISIEYGDIKKDISWTNKSIIDKVVAKYGFIDVYSV